MSQDDRKISKSINANPIADTELDRTLRRAIRTKHLLRFRYKDQERIAEPHDYGIQEGIVRLFYYQVGGQSSRLPGWRLVDVHEMRDCETLERRFAGNREAPSSRHHRWDQFFIRVGRRQIEHEAPSRKPA